ncbi:MAG: protein kinase [Acidobacteria bacterium]|nr:protein kinase [Acidobacteriota bacterium]
MIGATISHYRITEKLGEGGMGVVYKAEDIKLERTVALKFLAAHLLNDEEAKARFLREARAAAALHHPNICPVYEIDEAEGKTFLSMALIEGEPLEARIEKGPLPLKEALDIGRQIAEGLEAAHEKGVVHRDIKPANVMVDGKGRATIMDFGLAHLTEASRLTKTDQTMGTVAYMSPEQAQGMEVDNRSDIWALGVVLYEMVRGQRPFQGQYDQALLYEIVHQEPEPLTGVRAGVPMELEFIVGKCLAKDRKDRPSSAEEITRDLRTLGEKLKSGRSAILHTGMATGAHAATAKPPQAEASLATHPLVKYRVIEDAQATGDIIRYVAEDTELRRSVSIRVLPQSSEKQIEQRQRRQQKVALVLSALLVAFMGLSAVLWFRGSSPEASQETVRFSLTPQNLMASLEARAVISPDGRQIVFLAEEGVERMLWVRDLDGETPRRLEGTEGAQDPFWSPDSQWIGFGTDTELKRIAAGGGEPVVLCELPHASHSFSLMGASWSPDGDRIVFSSGLKLYEVASRGGAPKLLLEPDGGAAFVGSPHFLPRTAGSPALIYTFGIASRPRLGVLDLSTGERRELAPGELSNAR